LRIYVSIYRSILWGLFLSLPIGVLYFVFPSFLFVFSVILDGLLVGPSRMLLDVFTERGIYVKRNGKWRRFALALSYDNPLANSSAILSGVLMLFAAMKTHSYHYYYHYYNYYS